MGSWIWMLMNENAHLDSKFVMLTTGSGGGAVGTCVDQDEGEQEKYIRVF